MADTDKKYNRDRELIEYFMALKATYAEQRQPWELKWKQARDAYMVEPDSDKVYNGRANIRVPIVTWKVKGIVSRLMKIMFNTEPFGRIESPKSKPMRHDFTELWNKYIFEKQIPEIGFKQAYKTFTRGKVIEGTAFAKITQEYATEQFSYFDDQQPEEIVVKDNTFFRPMLITEFYSDITKNNIYESAANIHSTVLSLEEIRKNERRTETEVEEVIDPQTGEVKAYTETRRDVGMYHNIELLTTSDTKSQLTEEQMTYMQQLGFSAKQVAVYQRSLQETLKTGNVRVDECYGWYDLDGDGYSEEVIVVIANGTVVIRAEPTPFRHKRFKRPFIRGVFEEIQNCLYGLSTVVLGHSLWMELNACRSQATDARSFSIFPMWYVDQSKQVIWDKVWRPGGIIKGNGPNGMTPIINPNLENAANADSAIIQKDMDQLYSLSPVQEGSSDRRMIPDTASGTAAIISQNDMPLNDLIDTAMDNELKPFIEMLYERNLRFKDVTELLSVWDEKDLQEAGITKGPDGRLQVDIKDMLISMNVKLLGTLELSNEVAHQAGWTAFGNLAATIPPLASRVNWTEYGDKMLRSFGIKDDSSNIYIDEESYQAAQKEKAAAEAQAQQAALQHAEQMEMAKMSRSIQEHQAKKAIDTESDIVKMQSEAVLEKATGEKVK